MRVILPPTKPGIGPDERVVFLAGSIEMGRAVDWQTSLAEALASCPGALLNPRRAAWDSSWPNDPAFPLFREQVEWELEGMERAGLIAFYFEPSTQAPVTLLELGLAARTGKAVVCCPAGFWRKGNVEIVCQRYGVRMVETLEALAGQIRSYCEAPARPGS